MDTSFTSELDVSSTSHQLVSSTPHATPRKSRPERTFAVPNEPVGKIVGTCDACKKQYRSKKYFVCHKLSHTLKDAATKYPDEKVLLEKKCQLYQQVIVKMKETSAVGRWGEASCQLVGEVLNKREDFEMFTDKVHEKLVGIVTTKRMCLPSALHQCIQGGIEELLSGIDFRHLVLALFQSVVPSVPKEAVNTFIVEYVFSMGNELLHFIAMCLLQDCPKKLSPEIEISQTERQNIHYVSGSIIRNFLKKCNRFKENEFWKKILFAIKTCILEVSDVVVSAVDCDKYWTDFCNRDALNFVGKSFMDFIVAVVKLLYALEKPDGSLYHEDVQRDLLQSTAKCLWDRMIGTCLDQETSIVFMGGIVRSFTTSYGRGIYLKHMNRNMERPQVSLALRKRLGGACT